MVTSLAALQESIIAMGQGLGLDIRAFSANHEGAVISHIYETADGVDGFLINPAALTRFGIPTKIAFADVRRPFIELHFANVAALGWEGGMTTPVATGVVMGFRHYTGALFANGGTGNYFFHYIPGRLSRGCNDSWGSFGMFHVDKDFNITNYNASYFAAQLINQEWVQPVDRMHRVFRATSDARGGRHASCPR